MPQMKPLNWLYLFLSFSLIMILMNILNFYSLNLTNNLSTKINKNTNLFTQWKW